MPMKYSTFRSNMCEPSRCSSTALLVSGVTQFRRPISSSGPQGLLDTCRPSWECSASHVNSLDMPCSSLSGFDGGLLLDQRAVQLRAAVAEEVELVLAGDDVVLVARLLDVDLGDEERLGRHVGLGEAGAVRVDD